MEGVNSELIHLSASLIPSVPAGVEEGALQIVRKQGRTLK